MIPKVSKGGDMKGLMRYLVDTRQHFADGKRNVHENPHVVGGDPFVMALYEANELSAKDASEIASYIDEPRKTYGVEVKAKVWTQDENGKRVPVMVDNPETGGKRQAMRDETVWHCSLSLPREDGPLSDAEWDSITRDFMDQMGFTESSGKTPARWVAVHHGPSKDGNDHVHIAASTVREDGTRWDGRFRDFKNAQQAARTIERKYGLTVLTGREDGTAERGYTKAEQATAEKMGLRTTLRGELAQRVRSAATASTSEAEWVRRVRDDGMVIKPFFAAGTNDVVSGYRVALKTGNRNDRLMFLKGSGLGRDLSLPRVRENWPEPTIEQAEEASREWQAAFRGQPPTTKGGRETKPMAPTAPEVAARNFEAFNQRLSSAPLNDRMAWADAARDVSGALGAWAKADPAQRDMLNDAARVMARSAQTRRAPVAPGRRVKESPMGTAFVFMAMKDKDKPKVVASVFLRQMLKTAEAVRDYHQQGGNMRQAQAIERDVLARLQHVSTAGYGQSPSAEMPARSLSESERAGVAAQRIAQDVYSPRGPVMPSRVERPTEPSHRTGRPAPGTSPTKGDRDGR